MPLASLTQKGKALGLEVQLSVFLGSSGISCRPHSCWYQSCLESQVPIHAGPYVSLLEAFCLYRSSSLHFSLRIQVRPRHFPSDKPDFAHRNHSLTSIEVVPTKQH